MGKMPKGYVQWKSGEEEINMAAVFQIPLRFCTREGKIIPYETALSFKVARCLGLSLVERKKNPTNRTITLSTNAILRTRLSI